MSNPWQLQRKRSSPVWRRAIVFFAGGVILTMSLVMLGPPGTAIIFIPLGLTILATNFGGPKSGFQQSVNGSAVV